MTDATERTVIDRFSFAPHYVVLIANALTASDSRTFLKTIGLGINESRVVSVLGHTPGLSQGEIASALAMNKSIVSRSLQTLVAADCVTGKGTARTMRFTLTETGVRHNAHIVRLSFARQAKLLEGIDPDQQKMLVGMLARMLANMPQVNACESVDEG